MNEKFGWSSDTRSTLHPVNLFDPTDADSTRYFEFTCIRYIWSDTFERFKAYKPAAFSGNSAINARNNGGLNKQEVEEQSCFCGPNAINVPVPSIPDALMAEFRYHHESRQKPPIRKKILFDSLLMKI